MRSWVNIDTVDTGNIKVGFSFTIGLDETEPYFYFDLLCLDCLYSSFKLFTVSIIDGMIHIAKAIHPIIRFGSASL